MLVWVGYSLSSFIQPIQLYPAYQSSNMTNSPLILYDGDCNLCNHSVRFVIKRDKKHVFTFASLQSEKSKKVLAAHQLDETSFNTFILHENGKLYFKSTAALKVVKKLNGPTKLLYIFIIVPPFIRNFIYDIVAKNRYKWFGRSDVC
jgi:predicted DCC family thiol-disulfide oxidoreductase YuxK